MNKQFDRLKIMIEDNLIPLQNNCIAIIGLGGVGSFSAETIARCGFKKIIIVDKDTIDITNLNRQLVALHSTIGKKKVDVMEERILDINPDCKVITMPVFLNEDNLSEVFSYEPDFVIDACDTIETKLLLIKYCLRNKIKFISSMGAANKSEATKVEVVDLMKTYNDPVAKVLRNKVKQARIKGKIPVAFSSEVPKKPKVEIIGEVKSRKELPLLGSNAFVPSTFGIVCANYAYQILLTDIQREK